VAFPFIQRGSSETVGVALGAVGATCSRGHARRGGRDCKSLPQPRLVSAFSQRSTGSL